MKKMGALDWVQLISGFALIAGMALVVLEMRQSRAVAEAQLLTDQTALRTSIQTAMIGEQGARVLAKACEAPGALTKGEAEVLTAFFRAQLSQLILQMRVPEDTGLLDSENWQGAAAGVARILLGTSYGRFWWAGEREAWVASSYSEFARIFDEVLETRPDGCAWGISHQQYLNNFGVQDKP